MQCSNRVLNWGCGVVFLPMNAGVVTLATAGVTVTAATHHQYHSAYEHSSHKTQWPTCFDCPCPCSFGSLCSGTHEILKLPIKLPTHHSGSQIWYRHDQHTVTRPFIQKMQEVTTVLITAISKSCETDVAS